MLAQLFHPAVAAWFERSFDAPTEAQLRGWKSIATGTHTLVAAPTGSGKTLAAFLYAIDQLVRESMERDIGDETRVLYISPLKALSNDIERNLQQPLEGIRAELQTMGLGELGLRTAVRTGDTPSWERTKMVRKPPHIFVTTPESLYILLTSTGGRKMLANVRTVIVDEIHALVRDKRGSHLALSLERLEALAGRELVRIGLSATQNPIEEVARYLVGTRSIADDGAARCTIVDAGHKRALDIAVEVPASPLEAVMSHEVWEETYDRLAQLIEEHRTTLVFVNTRRLAERLTRHLGERLGKENVSAHHGSLARKHRLRAEQRLKAGELRAIVATASLELGIDIGTVDLVCQIGSARSISALLQRVGRSGHVVGGMPKGRLFPQSRDDLIESAALLDAARRGELDRLSIPDAPLDILAQQIVAACGTDAWSEDELFALVRGAYPYRALEREAFEAIIRMLAEGFSTKRGRRAARIHRDAVNRKVRGRRGAQLTAITSGGAIPDNADYSVVLEPQGTVIGSINEDFAIESMAGDIFQLGNSSWRILRVERGRVRVEDAQGQPPTIPFWLGEAPGRTTELSHAVSRLRQGVSDRLDEGPARATAWLIEELELSAAAAQQIVEYLHSAREILGAMPTLETLVLERFFDESGGMQLVLHAPFGTRINRAWGLALRKRFCQRFNFELQAAATDDAIVLSLGLTHSFPLEDVWSYLRRETVRDVLVQAVLVAPMFEARWRWNSSRALAVPRFSGGRRVPPPLQRMRADDLLSVVFPDQQACLENIAGAREIPDHPLVQQTIRDCLTEAMDIEAFESLLESIADGHRTLLCRDLPEPSPLAQEIITARPYAFLDDAPLEERRTQAVLSRRWLDPETAADLGALDEDAIARVRDEAWPECADVDELHDALMQLGVVPEREGHASGWAELFSELVGAGRATLARWGDGRFWLAAERVPQVRAAVGELELDPEVVLPPEIAEQTWTDDAAIVEIVRGRLEGSGPTTAESLASALALAPQRIDFALVGLEAEGAVLRGQFSRNAETTEWCDRALLARIHRYTLRRLRREIEPVSSSDFMRFLFRWQHLDPDHRADGPEGLGAVLEQLDGYEAPAGAWETELLPARLEKYDPSWLDARCLSGQVMWCRLSAPAGPRKGSGTGPVRTTPIALLDRSRQSAWTSFAARPADGRDELSSDARTVYEHLESRGASFFFELVRQTRLLRTRVEAALGELVARGLITSDGFNGLRALLIPAHRQGGGRRRRAPAMTKMDQSGRWSTVMRDESNPDEAIEGCARGLLRRYGIVFRRVLERERSLPPWRDLLRVFRRLEARGEIRGGHFVDGQSGEHFALPDAVGLVRQVRREPKQGTLVAVSGADPVNLVGPVGGGERLPNQAGNRVLYRDGVAIAVRDGGHNRWLVTDLDEAALWEASNILVRRAGARSRPEEAPAS